jgi:arylsulfatase A-like enzyme
MQTGTRKIILTLGLLLFTLAGCHTKIQSTGAALHEERKPAGPALKRPNIIFIVADDMRREMCSFLPEGNGQVLTPAIDRLASEGMIMMGQNVVSPVCTPSRFNVLTGKYASRAHNDEFINFTKKNDGQTVIQWASFITAGDKTLASLLKEAGYRTGFVGKNHVVEAKDLYVFPDYTANPDDSAIKEKLTDNYKKILDSIHKAGFDFVESVYHNNPRWIGLEALAYHNQDWITQGALNFINNNSEEPFFLYMATTLPHGPTDAAHSWKANRQVTPLGIHTPPPSVQPGMLSLQQRVKEAGLPGKNQQNLLWFDDSIAAVMDALEKQDKLSNTLIVFFNDHGQSAKGTVYQGGVSNPSVIWKQGGFGHSHNNAIISNVDFAPTLLEYAGRPELAADMDGKSFYQELEGRGIPKERTIYFELGYVRGVRKGDWKYIALRYPESSKNMSINERQKILDKYNEDRVFRKVNIVNYDPAKPFSHLSLLPGGGAAEAASTGVLPGYYDPDQLYNLADDPTEQKNLATDSAHQKKLAEMKQELQKFLQTLPGTFNL